LKLLMPLKLGKGSGIYYVVNLSKTTFTLFGICRGGFAAHRTGGSLPFVCDKTMQFNVDITVRSQTKPTLRHQDLKRSQLSSGYECVGCVDRYLPTPLGG
ncbi:hypothetical protein, partial [Chamaesiphon sp. VAR_48_metabat_403]|uniref:hypothetical protein n=1 Tax=Chamaesiphon sp. VAR_48_metabat_403 TaxID=2964700 RepID=UPI00286D9D83